MRNKMGNEVNRQATVFNKIFVSCTFDKGLILRIYKVLKKLRKTRNPIYYVDKMVRCTANLQKKKIQVVINIYKNQNHYK